MICQQTSWRFTLRIFIGLAALLGFAALLTLSLPATVDAEEPQAVPDVPGNLSGKAIHAGIADVEWDDVAGADSYEVQLFYGSDWQELPGNGIETAFYGPGVILRNLPHEGIYFFRLRAGNGHGASEWSGTPLHALHRGSQRMGRRA